MHRKTMITPIASLSGTGNLTPSGTAEHDGSSNDDEFDFVDRAHESQYTQKRRSAERLFSKANRVEDVARFWKKRNGSELKRESVGIHNKTVRQNIQWRPSSGTLVSMGKRPSLKE